MNKFLSITYLFTLSASIFGDSLKNNNINDLESPVQYIFVTSKTYSGNLLSEAGTIFNISGHQPIFNGFTAGKLICKFHAENSTIPAIKNNADNFYPIISIGLGQNQSFIDMFSLVSSSATSPYYNTINEKVVHNLYQLWAIGSKYKTNFPEKINLLSPISFDENGVAISESNNGGANLVWTGTNKFGNSHVSHSYDNNVGYNCNNWSDGNAQYTQSSSTVGIVGAMNKKWIDSENGGQICSSSAKYHLYCIQSSF